MAELEAEKGISATYYLFLTPNSCPFYSLDNALRLEKDLTRLGHSVGQHIDARTLSEFDPDHWPLSGKVSFHCPTKEFIFKDFKNFEHTLESRWKGLYYADSRGKFAYGDPEDYRGDNQLQINLHPEWWFEPEWYTYVDSEVYRDFFYEDKPQ